MSSPEEASFELGGHTAQVNTVAFAPDGKTLASGGDDGVIKLWNLSMKKEMATLRGEFGQVARMWFSSDSKTLMSSSGDATIRLWEAATAQEVLAAEAE